MSNAITWTEFPSAYALSFGVKKHTLHELAEHLANAGPFKRKADCPWIKLATFGAQRTGKDSLRHDSNVVQITGVEGDYDEEKITAEQAVEMLERAGIKAIVYTSPSNGVLNPPKSNGGPRWRVLAPLSAPHDPSARKAILARVNGALGGILSSESFTLSQSYYYGEVQGVKYQVFVTWNDPEEGSFVDEMDELDNIAIYKEAKRHAGDPDDRPKYSITMFEDAVARLGRKLKTGDERRELLKQYIASRSGKGLLRNEIVSMVEGVISQYFDPSDPIDQANVLQIIDSFARKDAADASQPVDISALKVEPKTPVAVPVIRERTKETTLCAYPEPFGKVMKDICEAAEKASYKVQPELNMLGALIGMAASISGEYSGVDGSRFNLFGLGALESGGGKDMPRQMAENVASVCGSKIFGKPASGAALEDNILDRRACLVSVDEVAHLLAAVNNERAPAHLQDISGTILKLYSSSRGIYNRRMLASRVAGGAKSLPENVANPCLSFLGFSTPEGLGDAFTEKNLQDGLMGRMLYVRGRPGVVPRMPDAGIVVPDSVYDWAKALKKESPLAAVEGLRTVGSVVVTMPSAVRDKFVELQANLETNRRKAGSLAPSLYARSYEKVTRIASVLAIAENPESPVIQLPHVEWARSMVMASDDHWLAFVNHHMHNGDVTRNAEKLRQTMRKILSGGYPAQRVIEFDAVKAGMISRSHLLRSSKLDKSTFDKSLSHMHDLDELCGFDDKGKPLKIITSIDLQVE
jgi:hypothetical protein